MAFLRRTVALVGVLNSGAREERQMLARELGATPFSLPADARCLATQRELWPPLPLACWGGRFVVVPLGAGQVNQHYTRPKTNDHRHSSPTSPPILTTAHRCTHCRTRLQSLSAPRLCDNHIHSLCTSFPLHRAPASYARPSAHSTTNPRPSDGARIWTPRYEHHHHQSRDILL